MGLLFYGLFKNKENIALAVPGAGGNQSFGRRASVLKIIATTTTAPTTRQIKTR